MKMRNTIVLLLLFATLHLQGQTLTQTVRGTILESGTNNAIEGVEITCFCEGSKTTILSDSNGYFRFENVPVGRQSFLFIKNGYADRAINNLDVSAGKELVLQIVM